MKAFYFTAGPLGILGAIIFASFLAASHDLEKKERDHQAHVAAQIEVLRRDDKRLREAIKMGIECGYMMHEAGVPLDKYERLCDKAWDTNLAQFIAEARHSP